MGFSARLAERTFEPSADDHESVTGPKHPIKNIYAKLHVNSKSEAVIKALQNRIV